MADLQDHPFYIHQQQERAWDAGERRWLRWCAAVEELLGIEDLDGNQDVDGYSLDFAYDCFKEGYTPEKYADEARQLKVLP